jgi:hypothetical protein
MIAWREIDVYFIDNIAVDPVRQGEGLDDVAFYPSCQRDVLKSRPLQMGSTGAVGGHRGPFTDLLRCLGARLHPLRLQCEEVGGGVFETSEAFRQALRRLPRHSRGGSCSIPNRCRRRILASRSRPAEGQFPPLHILCVDVPRVSLERCWA